LNEAARGNLQRSADHPCSPERANIDRVALGGEELNVLRMLADKDVRALIERLGVILVALHFIVSAVHGAAHLNLLIDLKTWQTVYVLVVITALPMLSGFLLWRRMRGGFLLLLGSMAGGLVFRRLLPLHGDRSRQCRLAWLSCLGRAVPGNRSLARRN